MKFTQLKMLGFKSFVEPSEFNIETGLTGIVGPNGCGKSNLVEALRWVMGESSYRNMRASGMEDVIFSGSVNRPSRNTAEVTLVIDNEARQAPAAFNNDERLEVSRRIEREAGSVYRINGRDVRARDVQLLFADASTGAHSPAMVGQGRIGELIAAKPQARRALLEEAAGIAGLHSRRHEAELRLRAAEQNLERLDDVIGEIETQLDGLKRQARQAVRYRNLSGEIRKAEAAVLHLRWLAASKGQAEAERLLEQTVRDLATRTAEQSEASRKEALAAEVMPALRTDEAEAGAALHRLNIAHETLDAEEQRVKTRLAELSERAEQLAADITRERRSIDETTARLAELDGEETDLKAEDERVEEQRAAAADRSAAADRTLAATQDQMQAASRSLAELTAHRNQLGRAVTEADDRLTRLAGQLLEIEKERDQLGSDEDGGGPIVSAQNGVAEAEAKLVAAEGATARAEAAAREARALAADKRRSLSEAERRQGAIEAEIRTLTELASSGETDGLTPVIDQVEVEPGFEAALAAAFGDELDAPVEPEAPAHWLRLTTDAGIAPLPQPARPLTDVVKAPAELQRRLAATGVVDASAGAALQAQLRPGQRLVSRDGDLWRWDGYVAAAGAPSAAKQRLAARNRLNELEAVAAESQREVSRLASELETADAAIGTAEETEHTARYDWRAAQKTLDAARLDLVAAEREAARLAARIGALNEAGGQLARVKTETEAARRQAESDLADAELPDRLEAELAELGARMETERKAASEARAAVDTLAAEAAMRSRRLAAIGTERARWLEQRSGSETHIETLAQRAAETDAEWNALNARPAEIEQKRSALFSEIDTVEAKRREAADRLAEGESALAAAAKANREAADRLSEVREAHGRAEERLGAAKERAADIAWQISEALDCTPEETAELAGFKPDAPLPEPEQLEARLERLKNERERLGGVNLRAEEEAAELAERRDQLSSERDDLIEAIRRLRQGIGNLNREGRERLLAAFDEVNGHFQRLFVHLFGGGSAELQLTESDDPLEAGLEIMAKPPGKKPQTMTLLSGGEQALTAMALIFAVFLTNPAPICVLDEVDAPLDDANVERFCNLLDNMINETETRFIVVTHNPITMARMNRLYGVTMAERGVSQLVSVDLETAESYREAS